MKLVIAVLLLLFCVPVLAVNKCVDANGNVSYQAAPCQNDADSNQIEIKTQKPQTSGLRESERKALERIERQEAQDAEQKQASRNRREKPKGCDGIRILRVRPYTKDLAIGVGVAEVKKNQCAHITLRLIDHAYYGNLKRFVAEDFLDRMKGVLIDDKQYVAQTVNLAGPDRIDHDVNYIADVCFGASNYDLVDVICH